ncbi:MULTISPECIES: EamA family transporter RarD [unclassified Nocardioides]|uniref:EamA family transporter RarD n=1 Tax=unclassified Nocardioides TaxID=2615069 RepID=UPI000703A9C4|nr:MULTISPECIES: EamA family transporter RarD [unclassified Nocardioides]KQZ66903.1 protein rarD [Nocardioides sp. Root151]
MTRASMTESRLGFLLGVAAYGLWGAFPLYWPLLEPAGAIEILAHRVLWSMITMGVLVVLLRKGTQLVTIFRTPRTRRLLTVGAAVIAVNWATYIWGVNNGHVVEAALGYFINPLVTVLMGVLLLRETLRPLQWMATGVAAVAVVVLTIDYGRPPWVALVLAFSFGTYGLAKKQANTGAVESLTFETIVLAPVAAAYIAFLVATGNSEFGAHGVGHALLLTTTGAVTAVPLICFGAAAIRLPMVTLGLLQYLAPIIQFALGVLLFHEDMPVGRWIGFALVWLALSVFTVEAIRHRHRQLRLTAEACAV